MSFQLHSTTLSCFELVQSFFHLAFTIFCIPTQEPASIAASVCVTNYRKSTVMRLGRFGDTIVLSNGTKSKFEGVLFKILHTAAIALSSL